MIIETWGELVSRLDTALGFAKALRLEAAGTRFNSYRTRIAALEAIRVEKGDAAAFDQFRAESELNAVALSESQELTTRSAVYPPGPCEEEASGGAQRARAALR